MLVRVSRIEASLLQTGVTLQPGELPASPGLHSAIRRVTRRLAPFLMMMYVVSFLDRANVSFAKQALESSRGISERVYALAAGLFFLSYSSFGFPSNLILHRMGARLWISLLMVGWGLLSMATMFVSGPASFYTLRLLLGAFEAGFFPGIILYLTYWFPNRVRGQMMGLFYLGVPASLILGGPLSGFLLDMRLGGLEGWQWMFLVEGFLAVALGFVAWWYLDNKPAVAAWLPANEKAALTEFLADEEAGRRHAGPSRLLTLFLDWRVWRFVLIYGLIQMSTYGAIFYLPAEVSALLHKPAGFEVGLVSAIPWLCTLIAVYALPKLADEHRNHKLIASLILFVSGFAAFIFPSAGPRIGILALSIAVSGYISVQPIFWTFPTAYLADVAAAGGIALIGTGNLGGFLAPTLKVWADEHFHSSRAGLYVLAALTVMNAVIIALMRPRRLHKPFSEATR